MSAESALELEISSSQVKSLEKRGESFTLLDGELTTADGALTPTLKVRRKIVEERFRDKIDAMYKVNGS